MVVSAANTEGAEVLGKRISVALRHQIFSTRLQRLLRTCIARVELHHIETEALQHRGCLLNGLQHEALLTRAAH